MAKRLEDKPFHLLATHCQNGERQAVVDYVRSKGLAADPPNFTVSSFGGHPKVKGNGYVPYYMVFDHHGELVRQHMCGDYHGGDGLKMIEVVDGLLADVPAIYLDKEPFEALPKLAKQVGKLSRLPAAIKEITTRLAAEPSDAERAELERLAASITDYRERMLRQIEGLYASDPGQVVARLKGLQKQFAGTPEAEPIATKLSEANASKDLKEAVRIAKSFRKLMTRLDKAEELSDKQKRSAVKKLTKLVEGHDGLPIVARVRAAIAELQ